MDKGDITDRILQMDQLVLDYLTFRGFSNTVRAFESEVTNDKLKVPRVDKMMETLMGLVQAFDLPGLRDFWQSLNGQLFSRLDATHMTTVKKLELNLFRWYLCCAVQSHRSEKVTEFFETMTSELYGVAEWKDWFGLCFIKNPAEHPTFAKYFTKIWQDTYLLSLQNFLAVIVCYMPMPALLDYGEAVNKIKQLTAENEKYKNMIKSGKIVAEDDLDDLLSPTRAVVMNEIIDDFAALSHEHYPRSGSIGHVSQPVNIPVHRPVFSQSRSLETNSKLLQRFSLPVVADDVVTKVTAAEVPSSGGGGDRTVASSSSSSAVTIVSAASSASLADDKPQVIPPISDEASSPSKSTPKTITEFGSSTDATKKLVDVKTAAGGNEASFLLIAQEEYHEHSRPLVGGLFSNGGQHVATLDTDGVVKVWSPQPPLETQMTVMSKTKFSCIEWAQWRENLLLLGSNTPSFRLYDVKEKKAVAEKSTGDDSIRVAAMLSSNAGFVVSARTKPLANNRTCSLSLWDAKTLSPQRQYAMSGAGVHVTCAAFNHNYQLLLTGASDGSIRIFDQTKAEQVAYWQGHSGEVVTVQFCPLETSVYSVGCDDKLVQWSLMKNNAKMMEMTLGSMEAGTAAPPVVTGNSSPSPLHQSASSSSALSKMLAVDSSGNHLLTVARRAGTIYRIHNDRSPALQRSLALPGHKSAVTVVDWMVTSKYTYCLTGAADGTAVISSLLQQ